MNLSDGDQGKLLYLERKVRLFMERIERLEAEIKNRDKEIESLKAALALQVKFRRLGY